MEAPKPKPNPESIAGRLRAMPRGILRPVMAVAAIIWLLVDLLRGWTPLLITVFGRAAETLPNSSASSPSG